MELFKEINEYFNSLEHELIIFSILDNYDYLKPNKECYDFINQLHLKISNNMNRYNELKNEKLYNLIENDFITLKDLVLEYKENEYPLFRVKAISFLNSRSNSELKTIKEQLETIPHLGAKELLIKEIEKQLNYDEATNFRDMMNNKDFDESIDIIIGYIKRRENNPSLYLYLASFHMNYLLGATSV